MPIDLARHTIFNLTGTILPANGSVPTFKRASAAYTPYIESRNYALKEANIHEPRFLMSGGLLLETSTVNVIKSPQQIDTPDWVIGSEVQVNRDTDLSMTKNYLTDKVSASGGGNIISRSIYQTLKLKPGFYTLSFYLSKVSGTVTADDRIVVLNGEFSTNNQVNINELDGMALSTFWGANQPFENDTKKFKRVVLQFSVGSQTAIPNVNYSVDVDINSGYNPSSANLVEYEQTVTIAFILSGAGATFAIAGVQLEPNRFPTSFIESTFGTPARAEEILIYPQSPFHGLVIGSANKDWTCRFTLEDWEGDGVIFKAGTTSFVRADIINGNLQVTCGAFVLNDSKMLPQNAQVVIRNKANHSIRLYVDYELRAQVVLNNQTFSAQEGTLDFTPDAVRVIKDFLVLDTAIDDAINNIVPVGTQQFSAASPLPIPGMLNCLFLLDYKLPISEGKGRFVFTPVTLRAGESTFVRFPMTRYFSAAITSQPTQSQNGVAQQINCNVVTAGTDNVTNSTVITEQVIIDGLTFSANSASTGTWVTKKAAVASALVTQINNSISAGQLKTINQVSYSTNSTSFTLVAATAGVGFTVETSSGVGKTTLVANRGAGGLIPISNSTEFKVGRAYVRRNYREVVAIEITSTSGGLTVSCDPAPAFGNIQTGDVVFQPIWETEIAPGNYFADTLEDTTGIVVEAKAMDGFMLRNNSNRTISPVTPLIKMMF